MATASTVPLHAHDSEAYKWTISCFVLTAVSVFLRFLVRIKTGTGIFLNDCFLLVAFIAYVGGCAVILYNVRLGVYGLSQKDIPPTILTVYMKGAFATSPLASVTFGFARYSVLALCWHLFPKGIRPATIIVTILCSADMIMAIVGFIFQCIKPISAAWDLFGPKGTCINLDIFTMTVASFDMLCDFCVVLLPVRVVSKLQMPPSRKVLVGFIFAVGTFTSLICAIRIGNQAKDPAWNWTPAALNWVLIQQTLAVIAASLPTYGPLLILSGSDSKFRKLCNFFWPRRQRPRGHFRAGTLPGQVRRSQSESEDNPMIQASNVPAHNVGRMKNRTTDAAEVNKSAQIV